MDKPEALRLADWLDDQYDPTHNQESAAAELRRLHAQRDALLEALKLALPYVSAHSNKVGDMESYHAERAAQAAIAAVEGEKT